MPTTMLNLANTPDADTTRAIANALGAAPGVLAVRLSTAAATVAIDYETPQTSPVQLRATLAQAGVRSQVDDTAAGSCCGGCCGR